MVLKTKKILNISLLRWVLIVPLTIGLSIVSFRYFITLCHFELMPREPSKAYFYFFYILVGSTTAATWIFTSYLIAPKYKVIATWISYFIGAIICLFMGLFQYQEDDSIHWGLGIANISALVCGFILTVILNKKSRSKHTDFKKSKY